MCRSSTAGGVSQGTTQLCGSGELIIQHQDYQPQPDVINGGYISYGHTGDYNPPGPANNRSIIHDNNGNSNILAPVPGSVLNVSDPRFSATYGNPYLKQVYIYDLSASHLENMYHFRKRKQRIVTSTTISFFRYLIFHINEIPLTQRLCRLHQLQGQYKHLLIIQM